MSASRKIILVLSLVLASLLLPPSLGKHVYASPPKAEALQANVLPKENDEMRIMELEEYLSELRYYHKGLTGQFSPELMMAIEEFQKDQKSKTEHGHFSEADYAILRDHYWSIQEAVVVPEAYGFVADDDTVSAVGGWVDDRAGILSGSASDIICSLKRRTCTVIDHFCARYIGSKKSTWSGSMISKRQDYLIDSIEDQKITAHAIQDDDNKKLMQKRDLGLWKYLLPCDEVRLTLNMRSHEIIRTSAAFGKKDGGGRCEQEQSRLPAAIVAPRTQRLMNTNEAQFLQQCLIHMANVREFRKQENKETSKRFDTWLCSRNTDSFLRSSYPENDQFMLPVFQPKSEE